MPAQNMPIFKPNNRSMLENLKMIKQLEFVAWGAYKYKFRKLMDELAPRVGSGTDEYWGNLPYIGNGACPGVDNTWSDLLDHMGFDDEGKQQICDQKNQKGVDNIEMYFKPDIDYTPDTLSQAMDALSAEFVTVDKLKFEYTISSFDTATYPLEEDRPKKLLTPMTINNPDPTPDTEYLGLYDELVRGQFTSYIEDDTTPDYITVASGHQELNTLRLLDSVKVTPVDSNGDEVVIDDFIVNALVSLIIQHGGLGVASRELISFIERDETGNGDPTIYHDVVEHYGTSTLSSYPYDKFDDFHTVGEEHESASQVLDPKDWRSQGVKTSTYDGFYHNIIWGYASEKLSGSLDTKAEFLFYQSTDVDPISGALSNGRAYMRVEGLRKALMPEFFFYLSSYTQFRLIPKKKKWYEKLIGGIMKFITSIITAILEVFNKIPILRLVVQALANIAVAIIGVDKSQGLKALSQIVAVIVVTYITGGFGTVGGVLSGAVAFTAQVALSFASTIMNLYNSMMSISASLKAEKDEEENRRYNEQRGIEDSKERYYNRTAEQTDIQNKAEHNDKYDTFAQYNVPMPFDNSGEFGKATSFDNLNEKGMYASTTEKI